MNIFILDACALIAVLAMEEGADNIRNLFQRTIDHQILLMMKKHAYILACILFILACAPAAAAEGSGARIRLPGFPVFLNGVAVDNAHRQYPLIVYKDITYFPLTYYDCRFLGLAADWSEEAGLSVAQREITCGYRDYRADQANPRSGVAAVHTGAVQINGTAFVSENMMYPFLSYRDVIYCPLTWDFCVDAFGWDYAFDGGGLRIDSDNPRLNRVTLPDSVEYGSILLRGDELYYSTDTGAVYQTDLRDPKVRNLILQLGRDISDYREYPLINLISSGGKAYLHYFSGHNGVMSSHFIHEILPDHSVGENLLDFSREMIYSFGDSFITVSAHIPPGPGRLSVTENGQKRTFETGYHMGYRDGEIYLEGRELYFGGAEYFDAPYYIYKINIDTGEIRQVGGAPMRQFIQSGGVIWYDDGLGRLWQMDAATGEARQAAEIIVPGDFDFSGSDNTIAYTNGALYYISRDGTLRRLGQEGDLNEGVKVRADGLRTRGNRVAVLFEEEPQNLARVMIFDGERCLLKSADVAAHWYDFPNFPNFNIMASDGNRLAYRVDGDVYWMDQAAPTE
jgi:hypothetical protein